MKHHFIKFLLILFPMLVVGQGYYNLENFGNRSLLLGGNVTGSVEDLGLTYYNPARIALVDNPAFSINAKAYQFTNINIENVFGRNERLGDSDFNEVPSLVAGTFKIEKWENHHFAYAFISKLRTNSNIKVTKDFRNEDLDNDFEDIERFTTTLNLENKETDEWIGVSWGTKIKDNLSIGVSAFASIYNYRNNFNLNYATLDINQSVDSYSNEVFLKQSSYGMFWKVGLAWKLKKFDLGLNIDVPYLEVYKGGRFKFQETLSGTDDDIFKFVDFRDLSSKRKEPIGISIGASFPFRKNKIHMKIDWHGGLKEYDRLIIPQVPDVTEGIFFKEERRSVINFGIGGEFYLDEKWSLYGSFSTDFSPLRENPSIFDTSKGDDSDVNFDANFFHFAFGVDLKLNKVHLITGITYATGSDEFSQPIDFPNSNVQLPDNDNFSKITTTRWRFIVGLEIPIFGYDLEIK